MEIDFDGVVRFPDAEDPEWWRDPARFRVVIAALRTHGLWFEPRHGGVAGAKPKPLRDDAAIVAWSTRWDERVTVMLTREGGDPASQSSLRLSPSRGALRLHMILRGDDAETRRASMLDAVIAVARDLRGSGIGARLWRWDVTVGGDYRRPRPPRTADNWGTGVVLMIVDRDELVRGNAGPAAADELAALSSAPLPAGAERIEDPQLTAFLFVPDLTDDEAIARARGIQERWITSLVASEGSPFWNDAGDQLVVPVAAAPHPPLTLYDRADRHGYKAVFLVGDERGDADLDDAAGWVAARQLPDGTPLGGLSVVVTTRSIAVAEHARLLARGFARVLYLDRERRFWDPFPPGHWLEPA